MPERPRLLFSAATTVRFGYHTNTHYTVASPVTVSRTSPCCCRRCCCCCCSLPPCKPWPRYLSAVAECAKTHRARRSISPVCRRAGLVSSSAWGVSEVRAKCTRKINAFPARGLGRRRYLSAQSLPSLPRRLFKVRLNHHGVSTLNHG